MANGNGTTRTLATWLLGILTSLIVIVVAAGATASISTQLDVREIKTEQAFIKVDIQELKAEIRTIDDKLDAHRATEQDQRGDTNG